MTTAFFEDNRKLTVTYCGCYLTDNNFYYENKMLKTKLLYQNVLFSLLTILFLMVFAGLSALVFKAYQEVKNEGLEVIHNNIAKQLKIYVANDDSGPLRLVRHGKDNDGGYVVALKALQLADALLGYGIDKDNSFEDSFSLQYHKPSYGFDCGIKGIESKSSLFTFVNQCISSDEFLYNKATSSSKISSFNNQINKLNLEGKKLFIKMDIEGAEFKAFGDILANHDNITGIALEVHFIKENLKTSLAALRLLNDLSKDFVLIHVHGNNCCTISGILTDHSIGLIPNVIELSYINKNLVKSFYVANNQSHPISIDMPNNLGKPDAQFEILP